MMNAKNTTKQVYAYCHSRTQISITQDCIHFILSLINDVCQTSGSISQHDLINIKRNLAQMTRGQYDAKQSLNIILRYLEQHGGWKVDRSRLNTNQDGQGGFIQSIYQQSALASNINAIYKDMSALQYTSRDNDNLAWLLLTIMIDGLPFPIHYWCEFLSNDDDIITFNGQFIILFYHPKGLSYFPKHEPQSYTSVTVSPLVARAISNWKSKENHTVTIKHALNALNQCYQQYFPSQVKLSASKWNKAFQCLAKHNFHLPPEMLKDHSDPLRHTSELLNEMKRQASKDIANIASLDDIDFFAQPQFAPREDRVKIASHRNWPHNKRIKQLKDSSLTQSAIPLLDKNNITPILLLEYIDDLIEHGGIRKSQLASSSIQRYTQIAKVLAENPLSYDVASQHQTLQQWAKMVFDNVDSPMDRYHLYQFFCFMTQNSMTEHLDLNAFKKPTPNIIVDALSLSIDDVHQIIEVLLSAKAQPLQILFSISTVILAFYGKLRRGEVLRLRIKDIYCIHEKGQAFHLVITNTDEGTTKGNKTREVHVVMPEIAAQIIRSILLIKQTCPRNTPLISLMGENMASRERHYLQPVSRAMKYLFGKKARFQHFRHSGAKLMYQQGFSLINNAVPDEWLEAKGKYTRDFLTIDMAEKRFNFWLDNRDFDDLNHSILFDLMSKEIGHTYYATTRLSYLHGLEWVTPVFVSSSRHYTHAQLRYILDLSPASNDVSRIIGQLDPHYKTLSTQEKKSYSSLINDKDLIERISKKMPSVKPDILNNKNDHHKDTVDHDHWRKQWVSTLAPHSEQHETFPPFMWQNGPNVKRVIDNTLSFEDFSHAWHVFGKHKEIHFTKTQWYALQQLGHLSLKEDKEDTAIFCCPCNQKTLTALTLLRVSPLAFKASFTLYQNRKQTGSHKWEIINEQFKKRGEICHRNIIATGKSYLEMTIKLESKLARQFEITPVSITPFIDWWNKNIDSLRK
ncbi:site-specific integrase [Vibrio sp. SS-MA-C1-2]|uniref:site-specific integrase n=1 Tax=Vibrio sp. SS-MA-C1-2 TaxID=2908646 RepID=UPI001F446275|nr:site-specific integrase [Vibrio sp. SS-MA-C1-2]UJF18524.1 site-specific integrase [Vibrio sp. SS-MA-C1-2]